MTKFTESIFDESYAGEDYEEDGVQRMTLEDWVVGLKLTCYTPDDGIAFYCQGDVETKRDAFNPPMEGDTHVNFYGK
jgi:hypothetical protein